MTPLLGTAWQLLRFSTTLCHRVRQSLVFITVDKFHHLYKKSVLKFSNKYDPLTFKFFRASRCASSSCIHSREARAFSWGGGLCGRCWLGRCSPTALRRGCPSECIRWMPMISCGLFALFFCARVCVRLFVSQPQNGDSRRLPSVRLDGEFGHSSCARSQTNQQ